MPISRAFLVSFVAGWHKWMLTWSLVYSLLISYKHLWKRGGGSTIRKTEKSNIKGFPNLGKIQGNLWANTSISSELTGYGLPQEGLALEWDGSLSVKKILKGLRDMKLSSECIASGWSNKTFIKRDLTGSSCLPQYFYKQYYLHYFHF